MVHIKRLQEEGIDVLAIIGEIDASSSIELDLTIARSVGEGFRKILIDCSALEYISSAGLGVFMSYIEEFRDKNIQMVLFGLKEKVINTFEILGLAELLHILEIHINHPGKSTFVFEIIDDGSVFDINQFNEPGMDSLVHEKRKGGLGIRLVKSIMDKIEYTSEGGKNICRLTKVI